jgi:hypothetical protein
LLDLERSFTHLPRDKVGAREERNQLGELLTGGCWMMEQNVVSDVDGRFAKKILLLGYSLLP